MHVPFGEWKAILNSPHCDATVNAKFIFSFDGAKTEVVHTVGHVISNDMSWLDGVLLGVDVDNIQLDSNPTKIKIFIDDTCVSNSCLLEHTITQTQYASYAMHNGKFVNTNGLFGPVYKNYVSGWKVCCCVSF